MSSQQDLTNGSTGLNYNYTLMDPFKVLCQKRGSRTAGNARKLGVEPLEWTRGESVYLVKVGDETIGHVNESLGTKNVVADVMWLLTGIAGDMRRATGRTYYDHIAQDAVAMIVNDLITLGIMPAIITMLLAVGSEEWFKDEQRVSDLIEGWANACDEAGCIWGGGETPTLIDIIEENAAMLSGSATGVNQCGVIINPVNIRAGDVIVMFGSNGIHANGLTDARKLSVRLPQGYETLMETGRMFGEALLDPTHIYVDIVRDCILHGVNIKYCMNITGHGWRKIMRAPRPFENVLDGELPPVPEVLRFIQKEMNITDEKAYAKYNMGAGFAIIIAKDEVQKFLDVFNSTKRKYKAYIAGHVAPSTEKKVTIPSKDVTFTEESLQIR